MPSKALNRKNKVVLEPVQKSYPPFPCIGSKHGGILGWHPCPVWRWFLEWHCSSVESGADKKRPICEILNLPNRAPAVIKLTVNTQVGWVLGYKIRPVVDQCTATENTETHAHRHTHTNTHAYTHTHTTCHTSIHAHTPFPGISVLVPRIWLWSLWFCLQQRSASHKMAIESLVFSPFLPGFLPTNPRHLCTLAHSAVLWWTLPKMTLGWLEPIS